MSIFQPFKIIFKIFRLALISTEVKFYEVLHKSIINMLHHYIKNL